MPGDALRSATRWMMAASAASLAGFGLLLFGRLEQAIPVGVLAGLVTTLAGLRISRAVSEDPERTIDYPYDAKQRGHRLALAGLVTAVCIGAFGMAPDWLATTLGPAAYTLVGGLALLGPVLVVTMAVWAVDGIALWGGLEEPADPLVGAVGSMVIALVLAVLTSTTGVTVGFGLLVALGGVVPSLFILWSLAKLSSTLSSTAASQG